MLCWLRSDRWPSAGTSCFGHTGVTFDAENDRPGPGSLRGHFEAAQGHFLETESFVGHEATGGPPQELYRHEAASIYI